MKIKNTVLVLEALTGFGYSFYLASHDAQIGTIIPNGLITGLAMAVATIFVLAVTQLIYQLIVKVRNK